MPVDMIRGVKEVASAGRKTSPLETVWKVVVRGMTSPQAVVIPPSMCVPEPEPDVVRSAGVIRLGAGNEHVPAPRLEGVHGLVGIHVLHQPPDADRAAPARVVGHPAGEGVGAGPALCVCGKVVLERAAPGGRHVIRDGKGAPFRIGDLLRPVLSLSWS